MRVDRLRRPDPCRPPSRQIADSLLQSGRLSPATRPTLTAPQVAAEYGVSPATAAAALRTCLRGGLREFAEYELPS